MSATELLAEVEGIRRAEPARALTTLEAGFAAASRRAEPAERALLWRTRAHVLRSLRRTREAVNAYRRAAAAFHAAGDAREEGRCAIGLVDALMYLGRHAEARRAASRGRRLLTRVGDDAALSRLLNNEGNLWHRLDLPERALECYQAAVSGLERAGDLRSARMIGVNVGNCLSLLGRLDEARRHYREAQRAQRAAGALNEALSAAYNLAYLDFLEHRSEAALEGLEAVRIEAEARAYPSLAALARLDRAEIFLRLGAHEQALEEAEAGVTACDALGLGYETAKAELFAALACFRLSRRERARSGIERALTRFGAEGNEVWTGEALLGLATLWREDGNAPATAVLLSAARRRFAEAGDREREACAATLEVRARLDAGEPSAARRLMARADRRPPKNPSARLQHLTHGARAALARAAGDVPATRRWLQLAATQSERLAARILDEEWRATFWGDWGWPHRELALLELEHGDPEAAFDALEAGRGRTLIGRSSVRGASGHALPAAVRRWTAARQAREHEPRRTAEASAGSALRSVLAHRAPHQVTASSLRRLLDDDTLLVDHLTHAGVIGAIRLSRRGAQGVARLAREEHVSRLTHEVLFALRSAAFTPRASRRLDPSLVDALTELSALTLWPLLGEGVPASMVLAPTHALARLPWAALPLADGRVLAQSTALVIAPGLRSVMGAARETAGGPGLVVAVDTGDLAAIEAETASVIASFPGAHVLSGSEATVARFRELAPRAGWIHFAGHGAFRADAPERSGLRLFDRWLLSTELAALRLSARWVTLSACQTARALVRPGEEWFGLSRTLLLAGANAVVAAQWDVEDASTALLMEGLYRRLATGADVPRALAAEQGERAASGEHPLDWAGFVTLGGPRALGASRSARPRNLPRNRNSPARRKRRIP